MTEVLPGPTGDTSGDVTATGHLLLHDDLEIFSRQRAGDPELPEATITAARTARLGSGPPQFDVIELPGRPTTDRLALEFGQRGHRVFSLGAAGDDPGPGLTAIAMPPPVADTGRQEALRLATLASLRQTAGIATAVLLLRDPDWADVAVRARERWGWPIVAEAGDGPLAPRLARAAGLTVTAGPAPEGVHAARSAGSGPQWVDRAASWAEIDAAVRALFPLASVIVVSYNTLVFTRLCIASILANTDYPNYELILVDNGSTDGSPEELQSLAGQFPHLRVIQNQSNLGFGLANNQGLTIARGELLVLLNSDTMVPLGWLSRLAHHLADPRLGLIGPATNRTCNEAQIAAPYTTYGEFLRFARERAAAFDGVRHPIRMPMMFCVAWRRDVLDAVGLLDERYETGMFEDEDYSLRVKAAGYETAWAADTYVHHAYHASIGKLLPSGDYITIFRQNQERFEQKWGICWERHRLPPPAPS